MTREEKFNAIKEVSEKAYVSAQISNDDYNDYPNIPVSTIKGGRTFKYIYPSNISPARKAVIEKKEAEKKASIESQKKKYIIEFEINTSECCTYYNANVSAEVIMPSEFNGNEQQVWYLLKTRIEGNEEFRDRFYEAIQNENREFFTNEGYVEIDLSRFGSINISSHINEEDIEDFNEEITVNFTIINGHDSTMIATLKNYKL